MTTDYKNETLVGRAQLRDLQKLRAQVKRLKTDLELLRNEREWWERYKERIRSYGK